MIRVYGDAETSYNLGWFWWTGKQYISADNILESTKIICLCWKEEGKDKVHKLTWDRNHDDKKMLTMFSEWMVRHNVTEFVGHNSDNFDIRIINARLAYHKLPPLPLMVFDDTIKQCKRAFRLPSYSLNNLAKFFGLEYSKIKVGIQLWHDVISGTRAVEAKATKDMVTYCEYDVRVLEELANRIEPYVKAKRSPSRTLKALPSSCLVCGGNVRRRGTYVTQGIHRHPRGNCGDCGKWYYSTEKL